MMMILSTFYLLFELDKRRFMYAAYLYIT